jgi:polyferredoxin
MRAKTILFAPLVLVMLTCAGCFPGGSTYSPQEPAGFFSGVWHGWIAPVSLIAGLFKNDIRIYEPFNTGWWYDFGFYIAVISGFGSIALTRKKKNKNHDR